MPICNFLKNIYLFSRDTEHEWGRGRERERERIPSRLRTDNAEPNVGLKLTKL